MSTLAHVFEAAGLATVSLISIRGVAEKMRPPRALYCEFPLGRPLGTPGDVDLQRDVLQHAFALLEEQAGPVLVDYPTKIEMDDATPLACAVPPRYDATLHPAVDEAMALRAAYERSRSARGGATSVARTTDADGIPGLVGALVKIAAGTEWTEAGLPGDPVSAAHDLRTYYEEASIALLDGAAPDPGGAEAWFYQSTEAGKTLLEARRKMGEAKAPFAMWFYMARATR